MGLIERATALNVSQTASAIPATTGAIRLPNQNGNGGASEIHARNFANSLDVTLLALDANDAIQIGANNTGGVVLNGNGGLNFSSGAGGDIVPQAGAGASISIGATGDGVQLGSKTRAFGGGVGVVGLRDSTTAPTTNPANGGILYSVAGALKWRGSAGTVTALAPA